MHISIKSSQLPTTTTTTTTTTITTMDSITQHYIATDTESNSHLCSLSAISAATTTTTTTTAAAVTCTGARPARMDRAF